MNKNFYTIFKNTLQSFYKSKQCWIIFACYAAMCAVLIDFIPIVLIMPGDKTNVLSSVWTGLIDELSWMPMILFFTVICSITFNISDNTYILTKASSRLQLFLSKILAQLVILLLFILVFVICWLILYIVALKRTWTVSFDIRWTFTANIFNPEIGFTFASIIVPPILVAFCAIFLGGILQHVFKNGINMFLAFCLGGIGAILYFTGVQPSPEHIYQQSFLYPTIAYGILVLISFIASYVLIKKINIKI